VATNRFGALNILPSNIRDITDIEDVKRFLEDLVSSLNMGIARLDDNVIESHHLSENAVTNVTIAYGAVTGDEIASNTITAQNIANLTITGDKIANYTLTGIKIADSSIGEEKLSISQLSDISSDLGTITDGLVSGVTITNSVIRTKDYDRRVQIDSSGIKLFSEAVGGKYGSFKYGVGTKYGMGIFAYLYYVDKGIPFYIEAEQPVADMHLYNRTSTPSGAAEIGDLAVVNGKLMICTTAGTPGTWTVVGTQS